MLTFPFAVSISCDVWLPEIVVVEKLAETPFGNPCTDNVTEDANPFCGEIEMLAWVILFGVSVNDEGETLIIKDAGGGGASP